MSSSEASPTPHHCATTEAQAMRDDPEVEPEGEGEAAAEVDQVDRHGRDHREEGVRIPVNQPLKPKSRDARGYGPDAV